MSGSYTVLDALAPTMVVTGPVGRLIGSDFRWLVIGELQVVKVVKLVALLRLQECESGLLNISRA